MSLFESLYEVRAIKMVGIWAQSLGVSLCLLATSVIAYGQPAMIQSNTGRAVKLKSFTLDDVFVPVPTKIQDPGPAPESIAGLPDRSTFVSSEEYEKANEAHKKALKVYEEALKVYESKRAKYEEAIRAENDRVEKLGQFAVGFREFSVNDTPAYVSPGRISLVWKSPENVFYEIALDESLFSMNNLKRHSQNFINTFWLGQNKFEVAVPESLRAKLGHKLVLSTSETKGFEMEIIISPPGPNQSSVKLVYKRDPEKIKKIELEDYSYIPTSHSPEKNKDIMVFVRQSDASPNGIIRGLIVERPVPEQMGDEGRDQNRAIEFRAKITSDGLVSFEVESIYGDLRHDQGSGLKLMSSNYLLLEPSQEEIKSLMTDPYLRDLAFYPNTVLESNLRSVGNLRDSKRERFEVYGYTRYRGDTQVEKYRVGRADPSMARYIAEAYANWHINRLNNNPMVDPFYRMLVANSVVKSCADELVTTQ